MTKANRQWLFWFIIAALAFAFLYQVKAVLLPFVVGMLTAYFLDPAADFLERRGVSRLIATALITVTFFSSVALLFILLVPLLAQQVMDLVAMLPSYIETLTQRYSETIQWVLNVAHQPEQVSAVKDALGNFSGVMMNVTGGVLNGIFHSGLAVLNMISLLLITPVVAFYLLRDWDRLVSSMDMMLPREHAETIRSQGREIDRTIGGFLHGQFTVMMVLATFYAIGLSAAGLRFGLVIGIISGLLVIVPYLGAAFGMVVAVGMAFAQFDDFNRVMIVAGVYILGQVLEGNILTPKLVGGKVGLHPVWLIFGLLAGGALFGFVGVLIAVPVSAVIGVLTRFAIARYLRSPLYCGDYTPPLPPCAS